MASKYDIRDPNRQFNDWDAVEQQIIRLDKRIDDVEVGNVDFENISGSPSDNAALKEAFDAKTDKIDFDALEASFQEVVTALGNKVDKAEGKELMPSDLPTNLDSLEDRVDTIDDTITDIQTDLGNKVDKAEGKELMPEGLDDTVAQHTTDLQALQEAVAAIPIIQVNVMPTPSADYIGKIVQYVGPTSADAINGYFYQCGYDEELLAYKWMEKKVMNAAEEGGVDAYTKAETNQLLENKQDRLTSGQGIKIVGNVIMEDIINDTLTSPQTTWSSRYLETLFHSLSGLSSIEIVNERPSTPVNNTLYYVKAYEEGEEPLYEIWFYSNNTWTNFGTTAIDLTNYYTKTEVDILLAGKQATLTPGQGIDITNNNIAAKIDGTTLGINDAGNIYVKSGGGGGGGGFEPTSAQLAAMNSGINSTKVSQIETNKTDIESIDSDITIINENITDLQTDKQDKITDAIQSATPTDTDYLSDLNGTTNKRWVFGNIWNYIKGKITEIYYPVGSVIFNTGTDPSTAFGGTWELYSTGGKALYLDATAETTIEEELPNIWGKIDGIRVPANKSGVAPTRQGALSPSVANNYDWSFQQVSGVTGALLAIDLNAKTYNSIYKDNGHVKVNGITICAWKRTA